MSMRPVIPISTPSPSGPAGSSGTSSAVGLSKVNHTLKIQSHASFLAITYFMEADWLAAFKYQKDIGAPLGRFDHLQHLEQVVDEDGKLGKGLFVTKPERSPIYDYCKQLWGEMYWHDVDPETWDSSLEEIRDWFVSKLTLRFPLFGGCNDGRWKAQNWAIKKFPDWNRDVRAKGALTRNPAISSTLFTWVLVVFLSADNLFLHLFRTT